jgi:hypothetical protein
VEAEVPIRTSYGLSFPGHIFAGIVLIKAKIDINTGIDGGGPGPSRDFDLPGLGFVGEEALDQQQRRGDDDEEGDKRFDRHRSSSPVKEKKLFYSK